MWSDAASARMRDLRHRAWIGKLVGHGFKLFWFLFAAILGIAVLARAMRW